MSLITAKTFDNPIDAHLLRSKLENEGIQCFLFDENIVGINPLYNVTVGGIKLKILEEDVEKVKAILSEMEGRPFTDEEDKEIACPNCNSTAVISGLRSMKGFRGVLSAIASLLLTLYPFYYKSVYKCKACGREFKAESRT